MTLEGLLARLDELSRGAPVSAVLLALIVAVSLAGFKWPWLIERGVFRPHWLVPRREVATLVTNGFLHADVAHLLFNGFTFWAFAFGLERAIGSARFFALYAFGLFVSDAGTWLRHHRDAAYSTLGASGAILAVLFASIVYFPTARLYIVPIPFAIPAPLFALAYLAYTMFASRLGRGRINHDAHLSGAIAGVLFVGLTDPARLERAWRSFF